MLLVINVQIGEEPLDDLAARIPQRHGPRLEPAVYAVIAANAELDIERRAVRHRLNPSHEDWLAIVGVKLPQPIEAELLGLGDAGVSDPLWAEIITQPVDATGPDKLRQGFGKLPEAALAFAQRILGSFPFDALSDRRRDSGDSFDRVFGQWMAREHRHHPDHTILNQQRITREGYHSILSR